MHTYTHTYMLEIHGSSEGSPQDRQWPFAIYIHNTYTYMHTYLQSKSVKSLSST